MPRSCRCKRDTYLYELKERGRVVYRGIANNVERRVKEHARAGKRFTTYWYSVAPSLERVLTSMRKSVHTYKRGH